MCPALFSICLLLTVNVQACTSYLLGAARSYILHFLDRCYTVMFTVVTVHFTPLAVHIVEHDCAALLPYLYPLMMLMMIRLFAFQ
jgi:hypothetical protein